MLLVMCCCLPSHHHDASFFSQLQQGVDGRLGHGAQRSCYSPIQIAAAPHDISSIAAGPAQSACVCGNGSVYAPTTPTPQFPTTFRFKSSTPHFPIRYAWGNAQHGQLALSNPSQNHWQPALADGLREWRCARVCFGTYHAAARTVDGSVLTWGRQFECCLGRRGVLEDHICDPGAVEGLPRSAVVRVLCGSMHTAAVTRAGQVFTWGSGDSGAQGHG